MNDHSFVLYRSETRLKPKSDATREMIDRARQHNKTNGVTGFLHHDDGIFFHWLEGDSAALALTLDRISRDDRHCNMTTLATGSLDERRFLGCPMGYSTQKDSSLLRWLANHRVTVREQVSYANALLSFLEERAVAAEDCQDSRSIWRAKASM